MKTTIQLVRIMVLLTLCSFMIAASLFAAVPDSSKVDKLIAQGNEFSEKTFENQKGEKSVFH